MFITISEIIAVLAMTFGIGYIFSGYFKRSPDEDPLSYYTKNSVWEDTKFASMIAAPPLVFHELAHKLVAMGFGAEAVLNAPYMMYAIVVLLKTIGFPLLFFVGGYVSHTPLPAFPSALVSIAGIATNFLIWGICVFLVKKKIVPRKYYSIVIPMGKLSLFLGIFNLIPIPGFDGYHFITALFSML